MVTERLPRTMEAIRDQVATQIKRLSFRVSSQWVAVDSRLLSGMAVELPVYSPACLLYAIANRSLHVIVHAPSRPYLGAPILLPFACTAFSMLIVLSSDRLCLSRSPG